MLSPISAHGEPVEPPPEWAFLSGLAMTYAHPSTGSGRTGIIALLSALVIPAEAGIQEQ